MKNVNKKNVFFLVHLNNLQKVSIAVDIVKPV